VAHTQAHTAEAPAHAKRPNYLLIFIFLALLTLIEVGITYLQIPRVLVVVSLLGFMAFKVVLVAMFYMHLRFDSKYFSYLFIIPIPFVMLILAALAFTYYGRPPVH
jgi:cytochrome c oxidase subunit 4